MATFDNDIDKFLIEQEIEALILERAKIKARNREIARKLKILRMQLARMAP